MTRFYECCLCDGLIDHHKNAKGETYWTRGHNAQPIKEGQCCDWCNANVVLPKRFENIQKGNFYVEKNTQS